MECGGSGYAGGWNYIVGGWKLGKSVRDNNDMWAVWDFRFLLYHLYLIYLVRYTSICLYMHRRNTHKHMDRWICHGTDGWVGGWMDGWSGDVMLYKGRGKYAIQLEIDTTHLTGMAHETQWSTLPLHSTGYLVSVDSAMAHVDLSTLLHLVIQSDLCFSTELLTNWRCRSNGKERGRA